MVGTIIFVCMYTCLPQLFDGSKFHYYCIEVKRIPVVKKKTKTKEECGKVNNALSDPAAMIGETTWTRWIISNAMCRTLREGQGRKKYANSEKRDNEY